MADDVSDADQFREEGRQMAHVSFFRLADFIGLSNARRHPFDVIFLHAHCVPFIQKRNEAASRKTSPFIAVRVFEQPLVMV